MRLHLLSLALTFTGIARSDIEDKPAVKNIAIIGAGAAGSSAAYHLTQYSSVPLNITIFEKTSHIGGRTLTIDTPSGDTIEVGASIFITKNHILYNATQTFDLSLRGSLHDSDDGDITAIWDGDSFVFQTKDGEGWWWDLGKLWWRYGMSPYYAKKLVDKTVGMFLQLYEEPMFPFRSLTERVFEIGLLPITGVTGEQYLAENKISPKFSREIIQAATRVNYASNLAYIHGVESMVSFSTEGAVAVSGGNWQIFDSMVQHSGAHLLGNTTVSSISKVSKDGQKSKYSIASKDSSTLDVEAESDGVLFDQVIIATPWQFSHIDAGEDVLRHTIEEIPYTKLHVTLFSSPYRLHPEFFGLEPGAKAPSNVYTTLSEGEQSFQGAKGVGKTGFYSVSTLRTTINIETGLREYVYKIFSAEELSAGFLSSLLGTQVPEGFTSNEKKSPISWYHPTWFHSYPVELPRVTFQDPVIGNGVWYTSGMESFISTMETSALMGMNVARLIVDEMEGALRGLYWADSAEANSAEAELWHVGEPGEYRMADTTGWSADDLPDSEAQPGELLAEEL